METGSSVVDLLDYPWKNWKEHGKEAGLGREI